MAEKTKYVRRDWSSSVLIGIGFVAILEIVPAGAILIVLVWCVFNSIKRALSLRAWARAAERSENRDTCLHSVNPTRMRRAGNSLGITTIILIALGILGSWLQVIPDHTYIRGARATRAAKDIAKIESALRELTKDANCQTLAEFFDAAAICDYLDCAPGQPFGVSPEQFEKARELYTTAFYTLLRVGPQSIESAQADKNAGYPDVSPFLKPDAVARLEVRHPDLAFDPWGNLYQIMPGPWPENAGPIVFRTLLPDDKSEAVPQEDAGSVDSQELAAIWDFAEEEPLPATDALKFPASHVC